MIQLEPCAKSELVAFQSPPRGPPTSSCGFDSKGIIWGLCRVSVPRTSKYLYSEVLGSTIPERRVFKPGGLIA